MSQSYPIRTIAAEEFLTLADVPGEAFLESWPADAVDYERQVTEFDRTIAAFDGDQMVGTASSYSFTVTVPGASAAAAGITMVSVLPAYRRRGILSAMMSHQLADAASRGEALAILFASEAAIYGRFGFGPASSQLRLRIGRGEGHLAPAAAGAGQLRLRSAIPAKVQDDLATVYDAILPSRPGMLARDGRWWGLLLGDPDHHRDGMSPLRCLFAEDDTGPRGYALYRTKPSWGPDGIASGTVRIRELMAADPDATAAIWTDLLNRDLVSEVIAPARPIDEPLLTMLSDRRRARPHLSDGLWVRLIDLPSALCGRSYAASLDLVLEVTDPHFPANQGRWRLRASGLQPAGHRPGKVAAASCEPTSADADLKLTVQALGAAYLGGTRLGQLATAGQVTELTTGAVATLSAALSWDPAPWSCMLF